MRYYTNTDDFVDSMGGSYNDLVEMAHTADAAGFRAALPYAVHDDDEVVEAFWKRYH